MDKERTELDKARELISMLAIAVGLSDRVEYEDAIELSEYYNINWKELPKKYYREYVQLIKDWKHRG